MTDNKTPAAGPHGRRRFLRNLGLAAAGVGAAGCAVTKPLPRSDVTQWDAQADVVVVGSGAGGISAAIEARRRNADVLVLEKFQIPGGSSSLSGGVCYLGGGTPLQKALGFDDTVEDMYNYIIAASGLYVSRDKVQLYCENSLDHFQWLIDNGVVYEKRFSPEKELSHAADSLYFSGNERVFPYSEMARPAPRGHVPPAENQTGGRRLMQALLASAEKLGVKMKMNVSCERLIVESDGSIAGVLIEEGGERKHIRARKAVVLAAGGFIHNQDMLQRYAPELALCRPHWGRAGDLGMGIRMGMGVGAGTLRMHHGFAVLPLYPPENVLKGIMVNLRGQRYVPEDSYYGVLGHETLFRQRGQAYHIVDADSDFPGPDYRVVPAAQANTVAQLERVLKLPEGALQQTVDYYNQHAQHGRDPLLHKNAHYLAALRKPPFKAYDLNPEKAFYAVHTFGGLQTNLDAQVINVWGDAIPGLYAAGRTSAGLPVAPYHASGLSIGDCTFFGRRAGVHAALRGV